jgi:hypothetical protein
MKNGKCHSCSIFRSAFRTVHSAFSASTLIAHRSALLLVLCLLTGCGSAHSEQLVGPYKLVANDKIDQMAVVRTIGEDALPCIDPTVFSVGFNDRYLVARQHPDNDRAVTNYYYIDLQHETVDPNANVHGPMTLEQFQAKKTELGLPEFTRTNHMLE